MSEREEGSVGEDDRIRVLLADAHSLFREAVRGVLEREDDLRVVAEAKDGLEAIAEADRTAPDVALLDAALPNCDGIRATAQIKEQTPGCRVVVLASAEEDGVLVQAVEAGASGFLTKESPMADLIGATRAIHRGETLIPTELLGNLIATLVRRRKDEDEAIRLMSRLTRREREVLALLADGADNDGIAQALVISPQTARTHIQNALGKLGVHSRLEAAAFVMRNGILQELMTG